MDFFDFILIFLIIYVVIKWLWRQIEKASQKTSQHQEDEWRIPFPPEIKPRNGNWRN